MTERAIIIGAGQAAAQAAQSMRQAGFDGDIVMLGEERELPYQRPPLSKAYLQGELDAQRLYLRPAAFYEQQRVDIRLGVRATAVDAAARTVTTDAGETLSYDKLLLATGAPPRRLNCDGADLEGVYYLRSIADSDALRPVLSANGRIVIVGAGYIGLEVAASARKAGLDVTILEMADRVLARVAGRDISEFYEKLHRDHGVDLRLDAALDHFEGAGAVRAAVLKSGEKIACSAVLVGVGAAPATMLAETADLRLANGVWTDDHAQTSDPAIWAAGDCASHPSPIYERRLRLESVPNAIEQAKVAGVNMAGGNAVYDAVPWFWSDQYDVKLQTVGVSEGADETVVRGDPDAKKFSVWYFQRGRLLAVDAVNDPAAFAISKRHIAGKTEIDRARLADPDTDLKSFIS
ncbi:MAG: FAD-dependent oxidoreductase [Parvularculaceae bacterium]|nr:FAD-dependent oxidoreductase [Parvularculaceae bacterium]